MLLFVKQLQSINYYSGDDSDNYKLQFKIIHANFK